MTTTHDVTRDYCAGFTAVCASSPSVDSKSTAQHEQRWLHPVAAAQHEGHEGGVSSNQ